MKIVSIRLENFASLYTGMGKTEVEIDFSKGKNQICLLVGKNGSGKTSLLSNLHPFPYIESIDVRNTQDLILEGKDGLKAMTILDGDNRYDIDIHYTIKGDKRKTSCYIRKNGQELNPSGLVRSYYEVLKTLFGIEPSFLRILRLGPNVSDIISMSATQRKEFIKNFLQDIDVYVQLHESAKEQSIFVKNQIKAVTYNLDKDPNTIQAMIAKQNQLEEEYNKLDKRKTKYAIGIEQLKKRIANEVMTGKEVDAAVDAYEKAKKVFDDYDMFDRAGEFHDITKKYEKALISKTEAQASLDKMHDTLGDLSTQSIKLSSQIAVIRHKISLLESNSDIDTFDSLMQEYRDKIAELSNTKPLIHQSSVYSTILGLLKASEDIIKRISDVSVFNIYRKLCKYSEGDEVLDDMSKILDKKIGAISEKIGAMKAEHPSWKTLLGGHVFFVPEGCDLSDKCPYVIAIEEMKKEAKKEQQDMLSLLFELHMEAKSRIADLKVIQNNIKTINDYNSEVYFSFGEIFADMISMKFDHLNAYQEEVKSLLAKASDYDLYLELRSKMDELQARKDAADEAGGLSLLDEQLADMEMEFKKVDDTITHYKRIAIPRLESEYRFEAGNYSAVKTVYDVYTEYTSKLEYYTKIKQDYERAMGSKSLETVLTTTLDNFNTEYDRVCRELADIKNEINHTFYAIQTRRDLEKQLKKLNDEYSNIELIREAVSMSKGIPLLYAQIYLKNIQILANDIIHEMFDQNISLLDFVITDKEFRMPYMVNGVEIDDVSCSSQGERTTIVLALSFALLQQMMGKYNILLLDEVDSALYKDNRRKFIKIVKDQMERIDCEQAFLITHNALFENYPVDIIQTSEMDDDYNKGHVIWKWG